jgi:thioredoxin-related protein
MELILMSKQRLTIPAAALALTIMLNPAGRALADGKNWTVDYEAAKQTAAEKKKDILLEFTGSDWCPPCKALKKNVFDTAHFDSTAPKHFVLVKLDYPNDKSHQTAEEIEQNTRLREEYPIEGFPTILLADAEGRPYASTVGYSGQDAEAYTKSLLEMKAVRAKRDAALAKAEKAEGVEKAKALDEALSAMDQQLVLNFYEEQIDQIVELDAENAAGLKAKYEDARKLPEIKQQLALIHRTFREDPAKGIEEIDKLIKEKDAKGAALQEAIFVKAVLSFQTDKAKAKEYLLEAKKVDPDSKMGKQVTQILAGPAFANE